MRNLSKEWQDALCAEFESIAIKNLAKFVKEERSKYNIYPKGEDVFCALNLVNPDKVDVVIIGQDPYHGAGQAHGLAFSVCGGVKPPPSLVNIFKEIEADVGIKNVCGDLTPIAKQGVLFLNTVLTVREGLAGSHRGVGWEILTKAIITHLNDRPGRRIFVLWGGYAKTFESMIDAKRHLILSSVHPSPLSAYGGFFGCKHFSRINADLIKQGKKPINFSTDIKKTH